MHKMHKRKEIQKNSCKMTQKATVLTLEEKKEFMTPYIIDFSIIDDTND
jgi:predicted nuclease of restriction endonuclease-like (RecB) superfamily